jgi:hypothetical protein
VLRASAMPVLFAVRRVDDVARSDLNDLFVARLDETAAFGDVEGLAPFVGVPGCARSGSEMHRGNAEKIRPDFDLAVPGLREAWERGDRNEFLVDTLEEPIRYTEGKSIGIKR